MRRELNNRGESAAMRRFRQVLLAIVLSAAGMAWGGCTGNSKDALVVASKSVTEQTILAEILSQQIERKLQLPVDRKFFLGGTFICHRALVAGEIDMYVEYTGTAFTAILRQDPVQDAEEVYRRTRREYRERFGVELLEPLGFNNTFAIMIRGAEARRLDLRTLSEAAAHSPRWVAGFGHEFMERKDGFQGLAALYGLRFKEAPRIMDLGLTYRALADGTIDLIAGDATNGLIAALDLFVLEDDRHYFPPYEAVPFVRSATLTKHPALREALEGLGGTISDATMRRLNYAVDGEHRSLSAVVSEFLDSLPRSEASAGNGK